MAIDEEPADDAAALAGPLTRRLARLVPLSPPEVMALATSQAMRRPVLRNREIVRAGRNYDGVFVLIDGVAIRVRVLRDGRRQVLNVVLPGDFIGFPACFFEAALYSITALSDAIVAWVPFATLFPTASPARGDAVLFVLVRGGDVCRAPDRCRAPVGA